MPRALPPPSPGSAGISTVCSLLLLMLLCVIALKVHVFLVRQRRMKIAREWVQACLNQKHPAGAWWYPQTPACPAHLEPPERLIVLRMAVMDLESPHERIAGLKLLLETEPAAALPMLREAVDAERDGEVSAWELRLIGLCRDKESAQRVVVCLADPDARVRAAAADALGLIHCPGYGVPQGLGWNGIFALGSNPPINLRPLINTVYFKGNSPNVYPSDRHLPGDAIDLPESMRTTLETMMLQGATSDERVAAARALLGWPPVHYRFRVAEWGVWINCDGQLKLVQSVIDEIPQFIHRTGNTAESLADRLIEPMVITKPILHLTADRPLAADVQVLIANGRPWFAFPRPDDFSLSFADLWQIGPDFDKDQLPKGGPKSKLPELTPIAEGYPWIAPPHRSYFPRAQWGGILDPADAIRSLGLRWQSLIVSPQQQPWMVPPPVGNPGRYGWWERLRKVPSSWLSSQGESERFLYYDGPTRLRSPVRVSTSRDILDLMCSQVSTRRTILSFRSPPDPARDLKDRQETDGNQGPDGPEFLVQDSEGPRGRGHGIYVEVAGGHAVAKIVPVRYGKSEVDLAEITPITGADVTKQFFGLLTDYGLTADEAAGLMDVWKRQFFETDGKRLLVILPAWDYDVLCPLSIRPAPTELVRLAILLTELPSP